MAIAKGGFGYFQVVLGRFLFIYEVGVGADPNLYFFLSGKVLQGSLSVGPGVVGILDFYAVFCVMVWTSLLATVG